MRLNGDVYRCHAGESFDSVALALYGDEAYAQELLRVNPELCTVPVFTGGEALKLPVLDIPKDEGRYNPANAPWKER